MHFMTNAPKLAWVSPSIKDGSWGTRYTLRWSVDTIYE